MKQETKKDTDMSIINITEKRIWNDSKTSPDEKFQENRKTKSRTKTIRLFGIKFLTYNVEYEFIPSEEKGFQPQ